MTKQSLEKALRRELEILNLRIDEKIIRGLSYAKEARRHKYVLSSIRNIRQGSSWFNSPFSFIS